jgi:heme/copper-type cytochrome/quinol oxidase subunit 2
MEQTFRLLPVQASTFAERLDRLYFFLIGVSAFFAGLIIILLLVFAVIYRRKPGQAPERTKQSIGLELIWTVIPLMLVMVMFVWGASLSIRQRRRRGPRKYTSSQSNGCGKPSTRMDAARSTSCIFRSVEL